MDTTADTAETKSEADLDDPSGRLAAYLARSQTALDLLALLTLWIVVVPPGDFGSAHHASTIALIVRIALSVIYGIDMTIRTALAKRHWHYFHTHLLGLAAVAFPPLRIIFSLRLVRSLFRRGNLERFLLAATVLVLNGAIIVLLFERHAPGSNIHTLGQSVWWSVVTVTTVGYGDYYPITAEGQVAAAFIMAIGLLTVAVVTAQVSSSFVEQAARRRATQPPAESNPGGVTLAELGRRLDRIEELLTAQSPEPQ
jgi:voltage-gated potassium channel